MSSLNAGQDLTRGASLTSGNGRHVLTLQEDGNLVLSTNGSPVWAAGTNGSGADRLAIQDDGNVVVYAGSEAKWATMTNGNEGVRLSLQDDGNLVVLSADSNELWATNTVEAAAPTADATVAAAEAAAPAPEAEVAHAPEPAPVEAPAAPAAQEYTVQSGDTLSGIALQFYGDANAYMKIAEANGIPDPDYIQAGQTLIIPA